MKRNAYLAIGLILVLVIIPSAYWHMNYRISRVGFHFRSWGLATLPDTPWTNKWYWTRDPELLEQVRAWRALLKGPIMDSGAFRQAGGEIAIEYANGRTESFNHLSDSIPGSVLPFGTIFLLHSQRFHADSEPFSEFLRTLPADPKLAVP